MSFDLFVWHEPVPITAAEARAKLERWGENGNEASVFDEHASVVEFHVALLRRFPALESFIEADIDAYGVWNLTPEESRRLIGMYITWSHVGYVAPAVLELAEDHGLVCYNPRDHVLWPNAPGYRPAFTLSSQSGPLVPDPDAKRIEWTASKLGRDNYFVIVERADGWYVQVGYGEDAGIRPGTYALEYREGAADRHFRSDTTDLKAVVQFMQEFLAGTDSWKQRHRWARLAA